MSWRDDLRRVTLPDGRLAVAASFRGVPFFVESADRSGGRRAAVHEFPGRDEPYVEDLGRRPRTFTMEGYVLGDDVVAQKDALLAALEARGAGELVHPYEGVWRVHCTNMSTRMTRAGGRIAVFQMEFTVAAAVPTPTDEPDLVEQVDEAATAAQAATEAELVEDYTVAGEPGWAIESLTTEYQLMADGLREELAPLASTVQEAAKIDAELRLLALQASSLVREPADLLAGLRDALAELSETVLAAPRAVLLALLDVSGTLGLAVLAPATTATREQERANQAALTAALKRALVIEAARLAPLVDYDTLDDAQSDVDAIVDAIDEQAEDAGTTAYGALALLRARVRRAVPGDAVLARLVTVEQPVALPSLLLAYRLYGSVERESEVIARNRVSHPGFVAGTLQVVGSGS